MTAPAKNNHRGLALTWDYQNRLVRSASGAMAGGGAPAGGTTTYAYDHAGERVAMVTVGTGGSIRATIYPNKYLELRGATYLKHVYLGSQVVATVESDNVSTTVSYTHPDHLSVAGVVTDGGGRLVETLDYYPYGSARVDERTTSTGGGAMSGGPAASPARKKFTGYEWDEATGLYYARARYYDAGVGRFLSLDPWEGDYSDPQSLNRYAYARNNPLVYVDRDGKKFTDALKSFGYAASQAIVNTSDSIAKATEKAGWWTMGGLGRIATFDVAGSFLQHSAESNSGPIVLGDKSPAVEKIKSSTDYQNYVKWMLFDKEKIGKTSFTTYGGRDKDSSMTFWPENGIDLFAAMDKVGITVRGEKDKIGIWNLHVELRDTYNFEFHEAHEDQSLGAKMLWRINNVAHTAQENKVLSPYPVTIQFTDRINLPEMFGIPYLR